MIISLLKWIFTIAWFCVSTLVDKYQLANKESKEVKELESRVYTLTTCDYRLKCFTENYIHKGTSSLIRLNNEISIKKVKNKKQRNKNISGENIL